MPRKTIEVPMLAALMLLGGLFAQDLLRAGEAAGKIEAGKPTSVAKPEASWKGKGRILGFAKNAPAFAVTVLDSAGKQIQSAAAAPGKDGSKVYEGEWLEPGNYDVRVTADGYETLTLQKIEVQANHDVRINLEFTK